jgi:hypothetical protein
LQFDHVWACEGAMRAAEARAASALIVVRIVE